MLKEKSIVRADRAHGLGLRKTMGWEFVYVLQRKKMLDTGKPG